MMILDKTNYAICDAVCMHKHYVCNNKYEDFDIGRKFV